MGLIAGDNEIEIKMNHHRHYFKFGPILQVRIHHRFFCNPFGEAKLRCYDMS